MTASSAIAPVRGERIATIPEVLLVAGGDVCAVVPVRPGGEHRDGLAAKELGVVVAGVGGLVREVVAAQRAAFGDERRLRAVGDRAAQPALVAGGAHPVVDAALGEVDDLPAIAFEGVDLRRRRRSFGGGGRTCP